MIILIMENKMIEISGNIWNSNSQFKCITTNGVLKKDESLVMGKGIALDALNRFPKLAIELGYLVKNFGNNPYIFFEYGLFSFPTKNHWKDNSDIKLIERSCSVIAAFSKIYDIKSIALPKPGCGNGNLLWSNVKPILEKYFDDKFTVYI